MMNVVEPHCGKNVYVGSLDYSFKMDSFQNPRNDQSFCFVHEGFVELEELVSCDHELVWKERARWIKLEEDVEECANRWGKPHIPCLTYGSLRELERNLQNGAVLLDLPRGSLLSISEAVVDEIKVLKKLEDEECHTIKAVLLTRREHQYQQKGGKYRAKNIARRIPRIMPLGQRVIQPTSTQQACLKNDLMQETHYEDASDHMYVSMYVCTYSSRKRKSEAMNLLIYLSSSNRTNIRYSQ